jgi:hypothetical protein
LEGWRCGSSSRALEEGPEFKLQYHQQNRKMKEKDQILRSEKLLDFRGLNGVLVYQKQCSQSNVLVLSQDANL